jgi:hypothetical protein
MALTVIVLASGLYLLLGHSFYLRPHFRSIRKPTIGVMPVDGRPRGLFSTLKVLEGPAKRKPKEHREGG